MKKIVALLPLLAFCACADDIYVPASYNVRLDTSNTYVAGNSVKFLFDGQVDNILFYSGETGSRFEYKDRTSVPMEQVNSAVLNLRMQARYGYAGGMDIYITDSFDGLSGRDGAADRATLQSLVDGSMKGWTKLDYVDGGSTVWTEHAFDLSRYLSNFALAFHWHPLRDGKSAQRTYWASGNITLDLEGAEPQSMSITDLNMVSVMMNTEIADPYRINAGNGSIIFNKPTTADIIFQGAGATALDYALDGWVISTPAPLNKVPSDKGQVIKNMQNYMSSYSYTYDKPGTYTATFVGVNSNYRGSGKVVKEIKINILPPAL